MIPSGTYYATRQIMSAGRPVSEIGTRSELDALKMTVERQNLLLQTLLMILLEKKVIHEDEFKEWMDYVDELDGSRDGRLQEEKSPRTCPECGRNSPRTASKCIYCNHQFEQEFLTRKPEE